MAEVEKILRGSNGSHVIRYDDSSSTVKKLVHDLEHNREPHEVDQFIHDIKHSVGSRMHTEDKKVEMTHHSDGHITFERRH